MGVLRSYSFGMSSFIGRVYDTMNTGNWRKRHLVTPWALKVVVEFGHSMVDGAENLSD